MIIKKHVACTFLQIKPMRNLQINEIMGHWYVIQYYSSSEVTPEYKCMQGNLEILDSKEVSELMLIKIITMSFVS